MNSIDTPYPELRLNSLLQPPELSVLGAEFVATPDIKGLHPPRIDAQNNDLLLQLFPGCAKQCNDYLQLFSGNDHAANAKALAYAYAGHQFGRFNPFLGDGRSASLGRLVSQAPPLELSLKGIGLTPFGFKSDGFASLNECLHEYQLCNALQDKGIPSVQTLMVTSSEQGVYRQGFKRRAILARAAPSFIRFGNFELCYFKNDSQELTVLCDLVITNHYTHLLDESDCQQRYFLLLREIVHKTAHLIALWQQHGFHHGMLNSDNMSVIGITLDAGESQFLNPGQRQLQSDRPENKQQNRYVFENQPLVGLWNCNVLGRAFSLILPKHRIIEALSVYEAVFAQTEACLGA